VWGVRIACHRSVYNGPAGFRLSPPRCLIARWLTASFALLGALTLCGCSYRLVSLNSKDEADVQATGSITPAGHGSQIARQAADPSPRAQADLAYARAAVADVLARGSKDSSVPWENPETGAGGNITPLATAYSEGGLPCRDFLTSYVHGGSHDWLQGAACRDARGAWAVTRLKPLKSG
jgi:surface antigen